MQIPPLRERGEDIILLLNHFLAQAANELKTDQKLLNSEVSDYLQTLEWAGYVRQLENVSRWLTVMATGREVKFEDLPPELKKSEAANTNNWEQLLHQHISLCLNRGDKRVLDEITPKFESIALTAALQKTGGRKKDAADLLGWGRNTLTRKLKELKIQD